MIRSVVKDSLNADYRIACNDTSRNAVPESLFDCREEVLGNGAADNLFFEHKVVFAVGLEANPNIAELTVSAGLLLMSAVNLNGLFDGFSVSNARSGKSDFHAELCFELVDDKVEMLFAQTGEYLLSCFVVRVISDRRIFVRELFKTLSDLFLFALLLNIYAHRKTGFGEYGTGKRKRSFFVADGVARFEVFELCNNGDITGDDCGGILGFAALGDNHFAHSLRSAGS